MTDLSDFVTARLDEEAHASEKQRAIVADYLDAREAISGVDPERSKKLHEPHLSLRMLAALWQDHPDYQEQWKLSKAEEAGHA